MRVSPRGRAFLTAHEGVALKAYLCPAGVWTIGAGLTAASGVVKPRAGMTITRQQADDLLEKALSRNYEPRVRRRIGACPQHVFDGATSFDYNTGRVHNAGWVTRMLNGDLKGAEHQLRTTFVTGGGKLLRGLQRRRAEEAEVIFHARWPSGLGGHSPAAQAPADPPPPLFDDSRAISRSPDAVKAYQEVLKTLGFYSGSIDGIAGPLTIGAVENFQRAHDLTVDGLVGPATRATLQRALELHRSKQAAGVGAAGTGAAGTGAEATDTVAEHGVDALLTDVNLLWVIAAAVAVGLTIYGVAWLWRNRGRFTGRRVPS